MITFGTLRGRSEIEVVRPRFSEEGKSTENDHDSRSSPQSNHGNGRTYLPKDPPVDSLFGFAVVVSRTGLERPSCTAFPVGDWSGGCP